MPRGSSGSPRSWGSRAATSSVPIVAKSCATVVSGGHIHSAMMSSKPTTEMSSGMLRPSS